MPVVGGWVVVVGGPAVVAGGGSWWAGSFFRAADISSTHRRRTILMDPYPPASLRGHLLRDRAIFLLFRCCPPNLVDGCLLGTPGRRDADCAE